MNTCCLICIEMQKNNYDYISKMQHIDVNTWLQGDILQN